MSVRARLVRAAVVCLLVAMVIVGFGARQIMGWFQSWSGYRCYGGLLGGDIPSACEHHVEYGLPGLVMLVLIALTLFLPSALLIVRRTEVSHS